MPASARPRTEGKNRLRSLGWKPGFFENGRDGPVCGETAVAQDGKLAGMATQTDVVAALFYVSVAEFALSA